VPPPASPLAAMPELAAIIKQFAAPLQLAARSKFYELVDRELGGHELGPGILARVCREVQRGFVAVPDHAPPVEGRR
jgi:hypothetical protein